MTRVLHVIESCAAGGIETTFLNVLRAWRQEPAWATHHVLALAGGSLAQMYRGAADAVTIAAAHDELEQAVLQPYDAIYFLFERCAYRLLPLVVARSRAAVVYGKGYDMSGMFRLNDGLAWQPDESMIWGADAATFTTTELAGGYDMPAGRGEILGKAADVGPFLSLQPPNGFTPPRIVCVANLHARKRLGDLVTAVARLRQAIPEVRVRFAGADAAGEGARLGALARELGIQDACELVGLRSGGSAVAGDIAASRVFALPSGCEGVPTAMLEAMAAARPVVMTGVGHIRGVVRDGVEGFLVAPGDIDTLTGRLRALLLNPERATAMGLAGRLCARRHDVRAVASRLRSVLGRAASGGDRRGAAA
jgi:glycosyltransferase involved in cell wall biosynthesis